jgi:hypothetical protein
MNRMDDSGAVAVSTCLAGLIRLEKLFLDRNGIGSAGGLAVVREAARLPALRTMYLRYEETANAMEEATKAAIRGMLPHITEGLGSYL